MTQGTWKSLAVTVGTLALLTAITYRLDAPPLFDDPNDAQYAEVAREMVESGEWVTPQLNYVLFLNKPPLLYWLIAISYRTFGVSEAAARIPGVLAVLLSIVLLYQLGRELFDPSTGLLAASIYASLPSTLLEARFVRPDSLLTAATIGALLAFAVAVRSGGAARRRALVVFQCALAAGLLAKGIVGLLLPGFPVAVILLSERRWDLFADLFRPRSWLFFALLVVPWHAVVALRHTGFAWDYIVNQHLLFFLDAKEPRDSIPISLAEFWGAFLLRMFPWTFFLPLAVVAAPRRGDDHRSGRILTVAWATGILLLFSAATSRLEHYSLPALPAAALLIALLIRESPSRAPGWQHAIPALLVLSLFGSILGFAMASKAFSASDWLSQQTSLPTISRAFFVVVATGFAASLVAWRRRPSGVAVPVCIAMLATMPLIHAGLVAITPINSTAPLAAIIRNLPGAEGATIVYEAPIEYQSCAGLNFYLRRRIEILRPSAFVPPPYLAPHSDELFIGRGELERRWENEPVLFVSDPLASMNRKVRDIVPSPSYILAKTNNRWLISNRRL